MQLWRARRRDGGPDSMTARRSAGAESFAPAAGGTPWKGRLRSYHATPQSLPMPRLPSSSKNQEVEGEVRTLNKKVVPTKNGKGHKAGAVRQPRALQCQLLQHRGRDPEHPIVIEDEVNEEYKIRDDQSAMMPLRRSPRFHQEDKSFGKPLLPPNCQETSHNRKSQNAIRKDRDQVNLKRDRKNAGLKPLARMKSHNKPHQLCQDPQDILTRKKVTDVPRMKSEKQQVKPSHSVVPTGKRKRGTERRSSQKRRSYKKPKSLPGYCQENVPSNEPKKSIHKKVGKDPSIVAKPKAGHERLINIDENIDEPSRTEREGMENFCGADDWTEEQDTALRKAYFTARPSPHFWKRVSKLVK